MNIDFPIQLDILDFIFKGIAIGIIASAPIAPSESSASSAL